MDTIFAKDNCPIVDRHHSGKDIWVSFIGDSVTKGFLKDLVGFGTETKDDFPVHGNFWITKRNPFPPVLLLARYGHESEGNIWLSYTFDFISEHKLAMGFGVPYSWGDFVTERGEALRDDDLSWPNETAPDVVFFSPGYHASRLNSTVFGQVLEGVLKEWEQMIRDYNATMPKMHLMLNMMPAPWMIPDNYADDRPFRTLLNEYRKNLAIIDTAKKFGFIQSVLDIFSIELPFNGHPVGRSAHRDAVHIHDKRVLRIAGDLILDTLCNHTTL